MRVCGSFSLFSVNVDAREWRQLNWDGILREIEQVSHCEGMDLHCTYNGHGTQRTQRTHEKESAFYSGGRKLLSIPGKTNSVLSNFG